MTKIHLLFTALLVCTLSISCDKLGMSAGGDVKSKDGRVQLHLPIGWKEAELPGSIGKIQAKSGPGKDAYVSVISEPKEDLHHDSIRDYAKNILRLEEAKGRIAGRTVSDPKTLKIGGYDSVQYEVRGAVGSVNIVYVKTFVETPTRWNQLLCWTTPSHIDEARGDFQSIYESFKELPK